MWTYIVGHIINFCQHIIDLRMEGYLSLENSNTIRANIYEGINENQDILKIMLQ